MTRDEGGTGAAPVRILRPESSVTSESALREKLISAASTFADLLRSTYGPKGLDKMLYKSNGEAAITNDGAKIVSELMVKHPTAKAFVSLGKSQESAAGDGVTGCLLFAGALMYEAGLLINKGLHPLVVIDGYQEACDIAVSKIKELSIQCNDQGLLDVATTSLTGKVTNSAAKEIAKTVVKAVEQIKNTSLCDSENILMAKSSKNTPMSIELINGIILEKKVHLDKTPSKIIDCKVVLINGELGFRKPTRDSEIEINSPQELTQFIETEDKQIEEISQKLTELNVNAVFSTGEINKVILHDLLSKGIFVLGGLDSEELISISRASQATTCPRIEEISSEELGLIGLLKTETINNEGETKQRIFIEKCNSTELMTIDVGGSDDLVVEETIRSIHDSIKSTCLAARTKQIVRGGGNPHTLASINVLSVADSKQGRERLGMEGFARALETIPATLAANAGKSSLDKIIELRSRLKNESTDLGVNIDGDISIIESAYEPTDSLSHSIILATETVIGLLRVDQLISARGD
jgi:chaperonin GroEL (HSP60 family)